MQGFVTPLAYFPPIPFVAAISGGAAVLTEIHGHFIKQTWRNRCAIAGPGGIQILVATLEKCRRNHLPAKDVKLNYSNNWQRHHWKSIETAYAKSPFFNYYSDDIKDVFLCRAEYLHDYNLALLKIILKLMHTDCDATFTKEWNAMYDGYTDLRHKQPLPLFKGLPEYTQVFSDRNGFIPNLSILDALFNLGPETAVYLKKYLNAWTAHIMSGNE